MNLYRKFGFTQNNLNFVKNICELNYTTLSVGNTYIHLPVLGFSALKKLINR